MFIILVINQINSDNSQTRFAVYTHVLPLCHNLINAAIYMPYKMYMLLY